MTTKDLQSNKFTGILFIIYLLILCWVLVLKLGVSFSYMGERRVNLLPFADYVATHGRIDKTEMVLNVLVFIPLGMYIALLFTSRSFAGRMVRIFLVSVGIECLQWVLGTGAFDTTDIVTNSLGGMIGLITVVLLIQLTKQPGKVQLWLNWIALPCTGVLVLLLVMLKLDMLPVRYR